MLGQRKQLVAESNGWGPKEENKTIRTRGRRGGEKGSVQELGQAHDQQKRMGGRKNY